MKLSRRAHKATALAGIASSAMLVALAMAPVPALAQSESHLGLPVDKIGVVSFTIRNDLANDARGTLEGVTQCGVKVIEFSSPNFDGEEPVFASVPVSQIAEFADEFGFTVPSLGVNGVHITDQFDMLVDAANTLGATYVRISGIDDVDGESEADYYHRLAAFMNENGAKLKAEGITLAYHNHDAEFEDLGDGTTGYDILLAEVDPEAASFELDLYWAVNGAADPVELISENPGRFSLYHVKDAMEVTVDGEETFTMTTIGNGFIDWQPIFDLGEVDYYFIENDRPHPNGVASTCDGYAYLTAATTEEADAGAAAAQPAIDESMAAAQ